MTDDIIVALIVLPAFIFLSMALLLFVSNTLEDLMLICERAQYGTVINGIMKVTHFLLQIIALPVSLMMIIMTVVLLSLLAIIQVIVWAVLMLFQNLVGVIFVVIVIFLLYIK
ncbi:hypothetical protein BgiBS90_013897 [Biomphalaria glabrata]|nr:hypothetical protein BgiBS90_013897 [Biomphalaria glabrata]